MRYSYAFASLLLFVTCAAVAQPCCTFIQFAREASSASVRGMAPSEEPFTCFTLAVGRGQTAAIMLTQSNNDTAFSIGEFVDNQVNYSFKMNAKFYLIDAHQTSRVRQPAPFTMHASVR